MRQYIAKQRDIGKEIAKFKRKLFQPVTKDIYTRREMTTACIMENKKIFSQTFDTPSMQEEHIADVNYSAEKEG